MTSFSSGISKLLARLKKFRECEIIKGTGLSRVTVRRCLRDNQENLTLKTIEKIEEFLVSKEGK